MSRRDAGGYIVIQNDLSGPVPGFNTHSDIRMVLVEENNLIGMMPSTTYSNRRLEVLSISNNLLSGRIGRIDLLEDFEYCLLHDNQLTGSISTRFGEARRLIELTMGNNYFVGTTPSILGQLN